MRQAKEAGSLVISGTGRCDIKEPHIRRWRRELLDAGASPASVTKTYRLVKAIMNTAVDDGLIRVNPCRVRTRAALVYLHGSDARQRAIADRISSLAQPELN